MNFYLTGIDYKRADIDRREEILKHRNEIADFFLTKCWQSSVLVTCNRFEVYLIIDSKLIKNPFGDDAYVLSGRINVFRHALRLCCGLESQLNGELQIFQQIASWYKDIPLDLRKLWQEACWKAREIRNICNLNNPEHNIANVVYEDIRRISGKEKLKGIVIGTGKIAELFSIYRPEFVGLDFAAHKNKGRAELLAVNTGGAVLPLEEINPFLLDVDFIISATKSPHFILRKNDISEVALIRKEPLYIYDLTIPRDVEPAIKNLAKIVLKNMDDLSGNFKEASLRIKDKLSLAGYLIEEAVDGYTRSYTAQPACT